MHEDDGNGSADIVVCEGAGDVEMERLHVLRMGAWFGCDVGEVLAVRYRRNP